MKSFEYIVPRSLDDAISRLAEYRGKARLIAGGTDLLVKRKQGAEDPACFIDLCALPDLGGISVDAARGIRLGATVTIRELELSALLRDACPVIAGTAAQFGHVAVRNTATLGGNLCNAVPSADMAPCLIALDARAMLSGPDGERMVPLQEFFTAAGKTTLKPAEILVAVAVPPPAANTAGVYLKHAARATGLAIVGVAVVAAVATGSRVWSDCRIVLGNVAPTPLRATAAEDVIEGQVLTGELIEAGAAAAARTATPRADSFRASREYKLDMVRILVRRALDARHGQGV